MHRSQVRSGDILEAGHRVIVVGLNCRDNCGSAAKALTQAAGFSITKLKRIAGASDTGRFVRIYVEPSPVPHLREIIGLILRRDHHVPIRGEDLDAGLHRLVRYLGSPDHHQMHTHDVAMVAIGCGKGSLEGGFTSLLKHLIAARYPGVVYEPRDPQRRVGEAQLARLGLIGRPEDPLPSWRCPRSDWGEADERQVIGLRNPDAQLV